jgi:hypothetical protein
MHHAGRKANPTVQRVAIDRDVEPVTESIEPRIGQSNEPSTHRHFQLRSHVEHTASVPVIDHAKKEIEIDLRSFS